MAAFRAILKLPYQVLRNGIFLLRNISNHFKTLENIIQVDDNSSVILGNALKYWQDLSTVVSLAALLRRRLLHLR